MSFFIFIHESHLELQCKKDRQNYLTKHYASIRKHFWSMKSWKWPSFSTFADPRFFWTKYKHSKPWDKKHLYSYIPILIQLPHFYFVLLLWHATDHRHGLLKFVFTSRLTGVRSQVAKAMRDVTDIKECVGNFKLSPSVLKCNKIVHFAQSYLCGDYFLCFWGILGQFSRDFRRCAKIDFTLKKERLRFQRS